MIANNCAIHDNCGLIRYYKFRGGKTIMKKTRLIDSTLREGEQAPGVLFTNAIRRNIIALLGSVGVDEIELGIASPASTHLLELAADARKIVGSRCRLGLWCRCRNEDILFAARCQPNVLSLSIPASDLHIQKRLGKNRDWVKRKLAGSIHQALRVNIPVVSVGFEDASRADPGFLRTLVQLARDSGAARVRLADTVGICSPSDMGKLVRFIRQEKGIEIGVHCHNDFGMATANSIAALESGADWLDATVLGLGERTGNCRLEEVVGFLSLNKSCDRYHPERLAKLCDFVAKAAHTEIAGNHPIVGKNIFTCETGLHQHGLAVHPETYEPYSPHLVGMERTLRFGCKSGRRALHLQLQKEGILLTDPQLQTLTTIVRHGNKSLNPEEFLHMATGLFF